MNTKKPQLQAYATGLLQGTAYSRMHTRLTKTLFPLGVSIPEWKLLGQVYEQKHVKLSELASLLSYDPPMVTKLVKQLEKKKLVIREHDKKDERAKIISNTSRGNALVEQAEPLVKQTMRSILNGVSQEEMLTYIKVLTIIAQNTEE